MPPTKDQVREALKRVKGPDLESNIVDLGLVSEVLIRDNKVYFSITIDPHRAEELEPLRQAAAKVVGELDDVASVTAVLTADANSETQRAATGTRRGAPQQQTNGQPAHPSPPE
ncbi:MAG: iron-sulfur cluster assembly protein, partial [Hyphomicrobiaceae bacterium]